MTNKIEEMKERFLQDEDPIRIGNIASNMGRIQAIGEINGRASTIGTVIDESIMFVNCIALEADGPVRRELANLGNELAQWKEQLDVLWNDPAKRLALCERAGKWSERLVELSGLLQMTAPSM